MNYSEHDILQKIVTTLTKMVMMKKTTKEAKSNTLGQISISILGFQSPNNLRNGQEGGLGFGMKM